MKSLKITHYLAKLGSVGQTLPTCLDPAFSGVWEKFLKVNPSNTDIDKLITICRFIVYLRKNKVQPFISPQFGYTIRPVNLEKEALSVLVDGIMKDILLTLRTSGLNALRVHKASIQPAVSKNFLNLNLCLSCNSAIELLQTDLKYSVLKNAPIPRQFYQKTKYSTAIASADCSPNIWLPFKKSEYYDIYLMSVKEGFAFRARIPTRKSYHATLIKEWKSKLHTL